MNDSFEKIKMINAYALQKVNGRSLSEIRTELLNHKFTSEEVSGFMKAIDRTVLTLERQRATKERAKEFFWLGVAITLISAVAIICSLLGVFGSNYYLIYFGVPGFISGSASMAGSTYFKRRF